MRALELAVYAAVVEPKPEEFRRLILTPSPLVKGLGRYLRLYSVDGVGSWSERVYPATCSWSRKGAAKFYDQRLQFGLQESHHKRGSFERFKMSLKRVHILKPIQKSTHFLRIPLITQASRSQFQSSLQQLTEDVVKTFPSTDDYVPADAVLPL